MKKRNLMLGIALLALTGCSSDSFFGFNDDVTISDYIFDDHKSFNDSYTYLDMSSYSSGHNLSDSDLLILQYAEERLSIIMTKTGYKIEQRNGESVNISQQLYEYIGDNYESYNCLRVLSPLYSICT